MNLVSVSLGTKVQTLTSECRDDDKTWRKLKQLPAGRLHDKPQFQALPSSGWSRYAPSRLSPKSRDVDARNVQNMLSPPWNSVDSYRPVPFSVADQQLTLACTPSPVFSSLRPTNHWMFEARFERSVTRRQHRVAPPTINRTLHFQLSMRRLAKLHVDQNVNKTRSLWRKNVKQHWNDAVSWGNQCWPQRDLLMTINVRDTEFLTDDQYASPPRAVFVAFNSPLRRRFTTTLTESVYILDVERSDPVIGQSQLVGRFDQNGTGNWVALIGQLSSLVCGGGSA